MSIQQQYVYKVTERRTSPVSSYFTYYAIASGSEEIENYYKGQSSTKLVAFEHMFVANLLTGEI